MTWTHCEVYWDLDFEPSETSGGQPVALFLVTSAFSGRDFVEMLVIPWWHLYPWWPFVAFSSLL